MKPILFTFLARLWRKVFPSRTGRLTRSEFSKICSAFDKL